MTRPAVVSCLFGTRDFDLYPPPFLDRCYFFTNRPEIAERAQARGWTPIMMPLPEEKEPLALSLQSKAVKFLAFLGDPYYRAVEETIDGGVLYFDHKFRVEAAHVDKIVAAAGQAAILIRSTPREKSSIWDEVKDASRQERYLRHMDETKLYIAQMLDAGLSADTRVCNTGLIYYADLEVAKPLAQRVLAACLLQKQPECQIFWALHAQPYADQIKVVDWKDPAVSDIVWQDPHLKGQPAKKPASPLRRLKSRLKRMM